MVSYRSQWLANGEESSYLISVAVQRSRRVSICPADIWLRVKRNSAVSKATRLSYGVQSVGNASVRGGGGAFWSMKLPLISHLRPATNRLHLSFSE